MTPCSNNPRFKKIKSRRQSFTWVGNISSTALQHGNNLCLQRKKSWKHIQIWWLWCNFGNDDVMMIVMMMGRVWRWQEAQTVTGETRSKKPSLPGELLTASVHKHLHHDHHHHHHYHHHLHHDHHYHHNSGVTITTTNEDAGSSGNQGKAKVSQNDRHVPQRLNLTVLPLQSLLSRWCGGGGWAIFVWSG